MGRATSQVVELSRKLIMSGLLELVGRGSIGQAVLAVVLAFIFFAMAFKFQPFESERLNFFKICSEAQLFGVLVPCPSMPSVGLSPRPQCLVAKHELFGHSMSDPV
jgi:hypothetical protein